MIQPVRIQRSRKKGARMISPNGLPVVYVGRSSKWGNPYVVKSLSNGGRYRENGRTYEYRRRAIQCLEMFKSMLIKGSVEPFVAMKRDLSELRGKNLSCWCPLPKDGDPDLCHADILLRLANE